MKLAAGVKVTVVPASATVPLVAPLTAVTVSVAPASRSVSLASSVAAVIVAAVSSAVVAVSSTATGASLAGVTVIVTWPTSVSTPSEIV